MLPDIVFRNSCMKQSICGISYIVFYDIIVALTIISIGILFKWHLERTIKVLLLLFSVDKLAEYYYQNWIYIGNRDPQFLSLSGFYPLKSYIFPLE